MAEKFYQEKGEYWRVMKGEHSNINYVLRVGSKDFLGDTSFSYGQLQQVGSQLFFDLAPIVATGSFVQVRQKMDMGDTIAVNLIVKNSSKNLHIAGSDWHYQPQNKTNLYYTTFQMGSTPIQLAIGSGVSQKELLKFFETKTINS